ncbi:MAG: bifunctional demethylmenaquinone methyltransferase/2-methoxy-6-polyprenyl-1,4-benzoquinol methylase UbiE [Prevotella sp.]|nr:bifunctional demethylmenaquinone methyltransferase/2-methoxy-6-polyprenyl-1,4-benzoquinol methylase UbiE [Prevotella sp.]
MSYAQEDIKPYGATGAKSEAVTRMFDSIAPTYDRLNRYMSWHIDSSWRRKALLPLKEQHPKKLLDIATGTADLAILAARMLQPESVVGADLSEGMMAVGRKKVSAAGLDGIISFAREDCLALSYPDGSFDAVISAFGIRNFQDLDKGLAEICRVLKKGGIFACVEDTMPVRFPMKQLFTFYSRQLIPLWGRLVSGDKGAYEYLDKTIEAFPQGEEMARALRKAGFERAEFRRMTFGICTRYIAIK